MQAQDKYGGWLSEAVVADFTLYARTLFEAFGDRVVYWTTFNEPWSFCFLGYGLALHAPGRSSDRCAAGKPLGCPPRTRAKLVVSAGSSCRIFHTWARPSSNVMDSRDFATKQCFAYEDARRLPCVVATPALPSRRESRRSIAAEGDSGTEPYVASHNVLRAHAAAVAEFRRLVPGGRISMNLNGDWAEPYTQSDADKVRRAGTGLRGYMALQRC